MTNPLQSSHEINTTQFSNNSKVQPARTQVNQHGGKSLHYYIRANSGYITTGMTCFAQATNKKKKRKEKKERSLSKLFLYSNFNRHIQDKNLKEKKSKSIKNTACCTAADTTALWKQSVFDFLSLILSKPDTEFTVWTCWRDILRQKVKLQLQYKPS